MDLSFPSNPAHGTIVELSLGLFFQYDSRALAWIRVDGYEALGLATPQKPGMMSAEDLIKIDGLIIPPPQSTLKGEDCPVTFSEGRVRVTSTDGSMDVRPGLDVINKIGSTTVGGEEAWSLHENTTGINFNLNVEALLDELKKNGQFTQVMLQGRQGATGEKGDDGIDELDTGPKGETGPSGTNSPYNGLISTEPNAYQLADTSTNRAIVDIQTEETAEGKFLVATRANIGNPLACPHEVKPKDITSPWGLVIAEKDNLGLKRIESPNECGNPCSVCVTSLHYLNFDDVASAVFDRFKERVLELKREKEELVAYWLRVMIALFAEQKASICCALENCRSSKRNERTRQYIETQRTAAAAIDAAVPGMRISVEANGGPDRQTVNMDVDKVCENHTEWSISRGVGCECAVQYTLEGKFHATDPRSLNLPSGDGLVDTSQTGVFGSDRQGILNIKQVIFKPGSDAFTADTEQASKHSRVTVVTGQNPPVQTEHADTWSISLHNFSIASDVVKDGVVTVSVILRQDDSVVGRYSAEVEMADLSSQTLVLAPPTNIHFDQLADPEKAIHAQIDVTAVTNFERLEALQAVALDYTIGRVVLNGSGSVAEISVVLKDDWNDGGWTLNGISVPNQGLGFVQLGLPAGDYIAEIVDCCANTSKGRGEFTGLAGIEFNQASGTDAVVERTTLFFPDLGTFTDQPEAKAAYMGSKIRFTHEGGQIRSWIFDRDLRADNNAGGVTICIRPYECYEEVTATNAIDGAVFVYRGSISPVNLIGLIHPYTGALSAADNYGLGNVTPDGADVQNGPTKVLQTTRSFFYNGSDGLSFYTIHGGTGLASINPIQMNVGVINNSIDVSTRVADDASEFTNPAANTFVGDWEVGTYGSDGFAIGPFDAPSAGSAWVISVDPTEFGIQQVWQIVGSDGNAFNISVNSAGLGDSGAGEPILFTPINSGCVMSFKQVIWHERGHRIGAACSAVVNLDGQDYIVVKRSLGDDMTCGGGETLSNACISQFIQLGLGHPAIAWPTLNGEEFSGIPTSGYQGFTFDRDMSDRIVAKILAGDMTNVNGDPVTNIGIVLFPSAQ